MAQVELRESRKFPSRRPDRAGRMDTLIVYRLDGKAELTFVTFLPSDAPTDAEIQAAIRADQAERATHIGKKFTI